MSSVFTSRVTSTEILRQLSVLLAVMLIMSIAFSGGALAKEVPSGNDTPAGHDQGPDKGAPDHDKTKGSHKGAPDQDDEQNEIDQRQTNTQRNQAIINYGIQVNTNRQGQRAVGSAVGSQYQYSSQTNLAGINYGVQVNLNYQSQIAGLNASVDQTQISRQANLAGINYGLQQNVNTQEQRAAITQQGDQEASVDQIQRSSQFNVVIINYGTQENLNSQTQDASVTQYSGAMYNLNGENENTAGQDVMPLMRRHASNASLGQLAS